jgi:hypothetical protein
MAEQTETEQAVEAFRKARQARHDRGRWPADGSARAARSSSRPASVYTEHEGGRSVHTPPPVYTEHPDGSRSITRQPTSLAGDDGS